MIYSFSISTPKDTSAASPLETAMPLCRGVIHQVDFYFPPGSLGMLKLRVNSAIHQIWPYNTGEFMLGDDVYFSFREHIPLLDEPYRLQAFSHNLDDTYDHSLIVRIGVLPLNIAAPWLLSFSERMRAAMGVT